MKNNLLLRVLFMIATFACVNKPSAQEWHLTGNNDATASSKLGTINAQPVRFYVKNMERMRIDLQGRVAIGTNAPLNILTVQNNGTTPAAPWLSSLPLFAGFGEQVSGNADLFLSMASSTPGTRPALIMQRSRGTLAAPTILKKSDMLGTVSALGYDGFSFLNAGGIDFVVDGNAVANKVPTAMSFITGSNATNKKERLKISSGGNFNFNDTVFTIKQATGALGLGTISPDPSAILDINSTKGVLLPRVTETQKNAIASPANGLLVYQTNGTPGFYFYNGGWQQLSPFAAESANRTLSNLQEPTAVNVSLLPDVTDTKNLGDTATAWKSLFISGNIYYAGSRFINAAGIGNNFIGTLAGLNNTTGAYNTGIGAQAMFSNTVGYSNTAGGYQALYSNINGYGNTASGHHALRSNTSTYNTASGYVSLYANTSGYANSAAGAFALYGNTTGSYNVAYGADALIANMSGDNNTAVGLDALRNLQTTSSNTAIGYYSGNATYNPSQGTFLGALTGGGTGLTNVTAVGYGAYCYSVKSGNAG